VASYCAIYYSATQDHRHMLKSPAPELAWLKKEFRSGETEFARIAELHQAYMPRCAEFCQRIAAKNSELRQLTDATTVDAKAVEAKLEEIGGLRVECQKNMFNHFLEVSHQLPPEQVATLLNAYLDGMSDIVLDNGGTIDKFVGDAVVAFWGAPIAREDDADRAVRALVGMIEFTQQFSAKHSTPESPLGRTRVGLHFGSAVVGNFGGEGRLSYTALGDAMNCAARLEGANKYLKTVALVSDEAKQLCTFDIFRPMGRIVLSGRATPVVVWEPMPGQDPGLRAELTRLWTDFDGGDRSALDAIEQICLTQDKDAALAAFACHLREAGPGGAIRLKEK